MSGGKANPAAGHRFELRVRDILSASGFVVLRSAGSRTAVDLIALHKARKPAIIQCKVNGRLDSGDWNALRDIAIQAGAEAVLAYRDGRRVVFAALDSPAVAHRKRTIRVWAIGEMPYNGLQGAVDETEQGVGYVETTEP